MIHNNSKRNKLKCPITSSTPSNYAGTAQSKAEVLVNKTVNEVIVEHFFYFSAEQHMRGS